MADLFSDWTKRIEDKVESIVTDTTRVFANDTKNAVAGLTGAAAGLATQLTTVATAIATFSAMVHNLGLPSPEEAAQKAVNQIKSAIAGLGPPPEIPDPTKVVNEVVTWAQAQAAKVGKTIKEFLDGLAQMAFWIRIDDELFTDGPESMYTKLIAKIEAPGRLLGQSFTVQLGGAAILPLAAAISAAQAGGKTAIVAALRKFLFQFPPFNTLINTKIFTPNPGEEVLIVAILCFTCVVLGLGVPTVVGGMSVFIGIGAAIAIAAADGNEIDVEASNPVDVTVNDSAGVPIPNVKLGPVVTLRIRKAR